MDGAIICIIILVIIFISVAIASNDEAKYCKTEKPTQYDKTEKSIQHDSTNIIDTSKPNKPTQPDSKKIVDTPKPNKPTTLQYTIDISGKKNVDGNKLCCLLLDKYSIEYFETLLNKHSNQAITVSGTRKTKKQIHNHIYTIDVPYITIQVTYDELINIGQSKIQQQHERQKLTSTLREKIKQRDRHTCQLCGKQMLDNVGIHIDHIIPISKGGQTVENNLQVLCSVCNLKKSNKITNTAKTDTLTQIKENIKNINDNYNLNAIFIQIDKSIQNAIRLGYKSYYFNITEYNLPEIAISRILSHYSTDKFDATVYNGNNETTTYIHIIW